MTDLGINQPVERREDARLLTGRGRFIADAQPPGTVHGVVLRSPHGHARIENLDVGVASTAPGVLAVITAADLAADGVGENPLLFKPPVREGTVFVEHLPPVLAAEVVRFVGDGVAFVVAETLDQARDAAELVEVDYAPLPAIADYQAAARDDAPAVWDDAPDNIVFTYEIGDRAATDAALAAAAHIVELEVLNNRVVVNAIETRGAIGQWDAARGKFTLETGTQMPNRKKLQLTEHVFDIDADALRVVVGDVGGGFGGKNPLYPEHVLVLYAARRLGRPVCWIGERGEAFTADYHGRDNLTRARLALDGDGHMLGIAISTRANIGAYTSDRAAIAPVNSVTMIPNIYRVPALHAEVRGVYTNTQPTTVYRGAGRPEGLYLIERLIDVAAHDLRIDRVELRRRNLIPADALPHRTPTGVTYDTADFAAIIEAATERADWAGAAARKAAAAERGKLRGIGMASYVERTGGGAAMGESARISFDGDGNAAVMVGSMANGQGHETMFSQIVADRLGLPFDKIAIVEGDTDRVATGSGTGGSWSAVLGGGAIWLAAERIVDTGRVIAAHLLQASSGEIEFDRGVFRVAGTDRSVTLEAVARAAQDPASLPPDSAPGLDETARFTPTDHTYPYGCHVCEVEIDRETGTVEIIGYTAVHDFGVALNPLMLAGQFHGGVAQGLGQALHEHTAYDADGQVLSGSFMDYRLPRADNLPAFDYVMQQTPAAQNPMGIKGGAESGAAGAPPAAVNAVVDALAPFGVRHLDMPATPEKIWRLIQSGEG